MLTKLFIITSILFSFSAFSAEKRVMTERQVIKVLTTINEGEIEAAEMAEKKAVHGDVKSYAKTMKSEHEKNKEDTKNLAKKNNFEADESDLAKALKEDAKRLNKELKDNDKANFDRAYVAQQIKMHETALKTLDEELLPSAKNKELKDHLTKTRGAVAMHLDHAKELQSKVK